MFPGKSNFLVSIFFVDFEDSVKSWAECDILGGGVMIHPKDV
jgi:hypothetical protein